MAWAHVAESFMRFYAYTFLPVMALLLVANWYVFATDLPGETRRRLFLGGLGRPFRAGGNPRRGCSAGMILGRAVP